ncbi:hypothetical protein CLV51_10245 [Chitinophaga niastensis]|uniref:Uncharacterized protein n=1 Tax=Chitinophaga niastensis TaxID=536980 RepID=A0A2P8HLV8_CHINA|nr:hypothetical protein CLV51_10245 [Chitinophaga niastensis]
MYLVLTESFNLVPPLEAIRYGVYEEATYHA